MDYLERLRELQMSNDYDLESISDLADEMEDVLGSAEMWNILRPAMTFDELLENLIYIARDADI